MLPDRRGAAAAAAAAAVWPNNSLSLLQSIPATSSLHGFFISDWQTFEYRLVIQIFNQLFYACAHTLGLNHQRDTTIAHSRPRTALEAAFSWL